MLMSLTLVGIVLLISVVMVAKKPCQKRAGIEQHTAHVLEGNQGSNEPNPSCKLFAPLIQQGQPLLFYVRIQSAGSTRSLDRCVVVDRTRRRFSLKSPFVWQSPSYSSPCSPRQNAHYIPIQMRPTLDWSFDLHPSEMDQGVELHTGHAPQGLEGCLCSGLSVLLFTAGPWQRLSEYDAILQSRMASIVPGNKDSLSLPLVDS